MQACARRLLFYSQILFWVILAALVVINSGMRHPASPARPALSVGIWVAEGRAETVLQQSSLSPSPVPAASLGAPTSVPSPCSDCADLSPAGRTDGKTGRGGDGLPKSTDLACFLKTHV